MHWFKFENKNADQAGRCAGRAVCRVCRLDDVQARRYAGWVVCRLTWLGDVLAGRCAG